MGNSLVFLSTVRKSMHKNGMGEFCFLNPMCTSFLGYLSPYCDNNLLYKPIIIFVSITQIHICTQTKGWSACIHIIPGLCRFSHYTFIPPRRHHVPWNHVWGSLVVQGWVVLPEPGGADVQPADMQNYAVLSECHKTNCGYAKLCSMKFCWRRGDCN